MRDLARQIRALAHGAGPAAGEEAFASAVHGLGLLVVTAMAATGTAWFVLDRSPLGKDALAVHSLLANLVWAYLIGHAGIALLHHLLGDPVLGRMFLRRKERRRGRGALD